MKNSTEIEDLRAELARAHANIQSLSNALKQTRRELAEAQRNTTSIRWVPETNNRSLSQLIDRLAYVRGRSQHATEDFVPYIAIKPSVLLPALGYAQRYVAERVRNAKPRLLDIGTGTGVVPLVASSVYGFDAEGLELNRELASLFALERTGESDVQDRVSVIGDILIHIADATTFEGYGDYDVLYMYGPCIGESHERLMQTLSSDAKPWARLVVPNGQHHRPVENGRFELISQIVGCDLYAKSL